MACLAIMKAKLRYRERIVYSGTELVEMVAWQVPAPIPPSTHFFKYRLVYIVEGVRVLGYDNERGKGDHRHFLGEEQPLEFISIDAVLQDFVAEVDKLRKSK
jgi:Family of unknown function (DUF6516)